MNPIVYKIIFPNGKVYFGITKRGLAYRRYEHESKARREAGHYVHAAIRKYGDAVKWEVVEELSSYEQAKDRETYWIELSKSDQKEFGYNLTKGGDGTVGCRPSEETRKRLSEAHKGYKAPQSQRLNMSRGMTGCRHKDSRPIYGYNESTGEGLFLRGFADIKKYTDFEPSSVTKVCAGVRNSLFGWKFKYMEAVDAPV